MEPLDEFRIEDIKDCEWGMIVFDPATETDEGIWIRLKTDDDATAASVHFNYSNRDLRTAENDPVFSPVSQIGSTPTTSGLIRSNRRVLSLQDNGNYYELNQDLEFAHSEENRELFEGVEQPRNNISIDAASAIVKEDGKVDWSKASEASTLVKVLSKSKTYFLPTWIFFYE